MTFDLNAAIREEVDNPAFAESKQALELQPGFHRLRGAVEMLYSQEIADLATMFAMYGYHVAKHERGE